MVQTKRNTKTKRRSQKKTVNAVGRAYISAGFNNTLITITDVEGNALFVGSAGSAGFKGSRKSTPYAATKAAEKVAQQAKEAGMQDVSVFVKGAGFGRISAIKALRAIGLNVVSISDVTPIPHNGCRPPKQRRV